jgi:hypothetical protein
MSLSSLLECETFEIEVVEKNQNTRFTFNTFFKSCRVWDYVEKNIAVHATDDSMLHVNCILGTEDYKHTQNV